jgi:hypothetical protein
MKRTDSFLPLAVLIVLTLASIGACYYVMVYQGSVPVLQEEEVR